MRLGVYIKDFKLYHQVIGEIKKRGLDYTEVFPGQDDSDMIVLTDVYGIFNKYILIENPSSAVRSAISRLYGKERFDDIFIGIDPGMRIGIAIFGDGILLEEFELTDIIDLRKIIEDIKRDYSPNRIVVRIGKGDEPNRNRIINVLYGLFKIELVDEYGTSSIKNRNTEAAKKIAMKKGKVVKGKMEIRPRKGEISEVQRKSRIASNNLVTISRELAKRVVKGEIDLDQAIEKQKKK
ncbi:MAG: hypothetical protein RXP98_00615 [Thermoplasmata archaeon]